MNEIDKISSALVGLQADMVTVEKSATNPFFKSKYAPLPEVMQTAQPLLAKHKLAVLLPLTNINGESAIRTVIIHESGQMLEFDPLPLMLTKQDAQGQGSAITYARRYAMMSVLGMVADEDDDGNAATKQQSFGTGKPTDSQVLRITKLAEEQGFSEDKISARLSSIRTEQQAIDAIARLETLAFEKDMK
jgi:hypothetical protein